MTELEMAWKEARSFVEKYPPNEAEYIGTITKGNTNFLFYKEKSGTYWYKSEKNDKKIS